MARRLSVDPAHVPSAPLRLRVREEAQAHHLTIAELTLRSGLTRGVVERYWKRPPRTIHLDALLMLAQALGVEWSALLTTAPADTERH